MFNRPRAVNGSVTLRGSLPRTLGGHAAMKSVGAIAVRVGKNGKKLWQTEQVYGGLFSPGP
jgi:hypothetical protein